MGAVADARSVGGDEVDRPSAVRERLEAFAAEVLAEAMNRPVQLGQRRVVSAGSA